MAGYWTDENWFYVGDGDAVGAEHEVPIPPPVGETAANYTEYGDEDKTVFPFTLLKTNVKKESISVKVDGVEKETMIFHLVEGENKDLKITAVDAAGNESEYILETIELDTTGPALSIV